MTELVYGVHIYRVEALVAMLKYDCTKQRKKLKFQKEPSAYWYHP